MKTLILTLFFTFLLSEINSKETATKPNTVKTIVYDACKKKPKKYYNRIKYYAAQLKRQHTNEKIIKSLKASMYTSCKLGFSPWRATMAFSLGHYAILKKLKPETISFLTYLIKQNPMGKGRFVRFGRLYQKLNKTGLDKKLSAQIIIKGKKKRFQLIALEGVLYLYTELRLIDYNHKQAMKIAFAKMKKKKYITYKKKLIKDTAKILRKIKKDKKINTDFVKLTKSYWSKRKGTLIHLGINKVTFEGKNQTKHI